MISLEMTHVIENAEFELSLGSGSSAMALQPDMAAFVQRALMPIVDEVLDRMDAAGQVIRIERIELDLGAVSYSDFRTELPKRLREELLSQLQLLFSSYAQEKSQTHKKLTADEQTFDVLTYFLIHGSVPWYFSVDQGESLDALFGMVLERQQQRFIQFLKTTRYKEQIVTRIVKQFAFSQWQKLLPGLLAGEADALSRALVSLNQPPYRNTGSLQSQEQAIQQLCIALFSELITYQGRPEKYDWRKRLEVLSAQQGRILIPEKSNAGSLEDANDLPPDEVRASLVNALLSGQFSSIEADWGLLISQYRPYLQTALYDHLQLGSHRQGIALNYPLSILKDLVNVMLLSSRSRFISELIEIVRLVTADEPANISEKRLRDAFLISLDLLITRKDSNSDESVYFTDVIGLLVRSSFILSEEQWRRVLSSAEVSAHSRQVFRRIWDSQNRIKAVGASEASHTQPNDISDLLDAEIAEKLAQYCYQLSDVGLIDTNAVLHQLNAVAPEVFNKIRFLLISRQSITLLKPEEQVLKSVLETLNKNKQAGINHQLIHEEFIAFLTAGVNVEPRRVSNYLEQLAASGADVFKPILHALQQYKNTISWERLNVTQLAILAKGLLRLLMGTEHHVLSKLEAAANHAGWEQQKFYVAMLEQLITQQSVNFDALPKPYVDEVGSASLTVNNFIDFLRGKTEIAEALISQYLEQPEHEAEALLHVLGETQGIAFARLNTAQLLALLKILAQSFKANESHFISALEKYVSQAAVPKSFYMTVLNLLVKGQAVDFESLIAVHAINQESEQSDDGYCDTDELIRFLLGDEGIDETRITTFLAYALSTANYDSSEILYALQQQKAISFDRLNLSQLALLLKGVMRQRTEYDQDYLTKLDQVASPGSNPRPFYTQVLYQLIEGREIDLNALEASFSDTDRSFLADSSSADMRDRAQHRIVSTEDFLRFLTGDAEFERAQISAYLNPPKNQASELFQSILSVLQRNKQTSLTRLNVAQLAVLTKGLSQARVVEQSPFLTALERYADKATDLQTFYIAVLDALIQDQPIDFELLLDESEAARTIPETVKNTREALTEKSLLSSEDFVLYLTGKKELETTSISRYLYEQDAAPEQNFYTALDALQQAPTVFFERLTLSQLVMLTHAWGAASSRNKETFSAAVKNYAQRVKHQSDFYIAVLQQLSQQQSVDLNAIAVEVDSAAHSLSQDHLRANEHVVTTEPPLNLSLVQQHSSHQDSGEQDNLPLEEVYISNAGLVLLSPYLPRLFELFQLVSGREFHSISLAERGVHLLQYLVNEATDSPEVWLVLNKLLCGVKAGTPITRRIDVTDEEKRQMEGLLQSVIAHWKVLGNTSVNGLRESFLQRNGRLSFADDAWHLSVEGRPFDMLLDQLPWSYSTIKYPWMTSVIYVEWRKS